MKLIRRFLFPLAVLLPLTVAAQSISPAQLERFKSLPKAQQEALARQYGIDLSTVEAGGSNQPQPQQVNVVQPLHTAGQGDEQAQNSDRAQKEARDAAAARDKNGGLSPFGYDLFAGVPSTFAPVTEIPVPGEYTLGPGDVLRVQLWGKENQRLELPVSRDGTINFPQSGPRPVAGLTFDEARQQIQQLVSEQYIGVQASVTLGDLRSMRVFILGEARTPGAYTVSSLSTITNALFVSGGVRTSGSLRNIQHKRNGKLVGELDLYSLLLAGDTSGDARLQAGDVIFIPPVGARAGIDGEVYRPALYELKGETSLQSLVELAGGLTQQAYPQRTLIERTTDEYLRILAEADLTTPKGRQARVYPGDSVKVASISAITGQSVAVEGAVTRPGNYAWVPGMRVSSLIANLDADLKPVADHEYAAIVRTDKSSDRISVLNLRLRQAVQNPGSAADLLLAEEDKLLIFADSGKAKAEAGEDASSHTRQALFAPVLKRLKAQANPEAPQQTIRISGPVRYPGEYPLPASRSVADAIFVAGGLKDSAAVYSAELARYAVAEDGTAYTRIENLNPADELAGVTETQLSSRDRLLIKAIPDFAVTRTVTLQGEVRYPGEYTFREGETLREIIRRAGGLTDNAFPKGAIFTREKLRQLEAQRLQEAEQRLQGDLLGVQLEGDTLSRGSKGVEQVEELLKDVQNARPVGRMVINLAAVLEDPDYQAIRLQDGDRLTVPEIPQSVSVFGEVQFPTSHLYQSGMSVEDYLEHSGGPTRQADESRIYIVKADGSVQLPRKSRWFDGRADQLAPGDTVIVPIDVDRLNQLELWTNVSQIVYQMALGAAALGNL